MLSRRRDPAWPVLRLFNPDPRPRPSPGTRWSISGHPAVIDLYPASDVQPVPEAQLDASGLWVVLRLA